MVDAYAGEPHFLDHLLPIWRALPSEHRGTFYVSEALRSHASRRRVRVQVIDKKDLPDAVAPAVMVASVRDLRRVGDETAPIFVEHGAGFWFGTGHPSYSGGRQRDAVRLFIVPSETVAERNLTRYPDTPNVVVGCPKLDRWHKRATPARHEPPVVCVSFHWNAKAAPETRWATPHYRRVLGSLAVRTNGFTVIGHGHPREAHLLQQLFESARIEWVGDFEDVLERADLYVNDASSTLYEFASTGRPVVVLNAPWYRRDVDFGLRFWRGADVGVQVDEPDQLLGAIYRALEDRPEQQEARKAAVDLAYAYTDGKASRRAADAIAEFIA